MRSLYSSILPASTQYARNAIFAGLMPLKIKEMYPNLWVEEDEDEGLNIHESELIRTQLERFRRKEKFSYNKVLNDSSAGEKFLNKINQIKDVPLNVVVLNFIDMLSHARTESKMIREPCKFRCSLPLAYGIMVPTFLFARHIPAHRRARLQGHTDHRPRHNPCGQSDKGGRRPQHQHQSAIQGREESQLQSQAGV